MKVELIQLDPIIQITITRKQALILAAVLAGVGGDEGGPRGDMDKLRVMLFDEGIKWDQWGYLIEGQITLPDTYPDYDEIGS